MTQDEKIADLRRDLAAAEAAMEEKTSAAAHIADRIAVTKAALSDADARRRETAVDAALGTDGAPSKLKAATRARDDAEQLLSDLALAQEEARRAVDVSRSVVTTARKLLALEDVAVESARVVTLLREAAALHQQIEEVSAAYEASYVRLAKIAHDADLSFASRISGSPDRRARLFFNVAPYRWRRLAEEFVTPYADRPGVEHVIDLPSEVERGMAETIDAERATLLEIQG